MGNRPPPASPGAPDRPTAPYRLAARPRKPHPPRRPPQPRPGHPQAATATTPMSHRCCPDRALTTPMSHRCCSPSGSIGHAPGSPAHYRFDGSLLLPPATWLGDVVAALEAVGALSRSARVPGRVGALCASSPVPNISLAHQHQSAHKYGGRGIIAQDPSSVTDLGPETA